MLQCNLNTNPEDALLIDNSKSYFQNVGYTRTSCFQMELKDVDPQNTANLGATVNFVIPKGADLMNQLDLMVEFNKATGGGAESAGDFVGWVDSIGHAMIDKVTFSVGTTPLEELTGEQLHIINELMRDDKHRYGFEFIGKTGRPLVRSQLNNGASTAFFDSDSGSDSYDRIISYHNGSGVVHKDGKKLIVPLGLFFTKHPSAAFPICAIAGVNDIRVQIKFRPLNELIVLKSKFAVASGKGVATAGTAAGTAGSLPSAPTFDNGNVAFKTCQLRVHYYHVTGPEATSLMNREHVRLMKMYTGNSVSKQFSVAHSTTGAQNVLSIPLSFLYPVQELIITIRKVSEMSNSTASNVQPLDLDQKARGKNLFAYHGGGRDPNLENPDHDTEENPGSDPRTLKSLPYLKTQNLKLTINGQTRHLDGQGIDRDYLMKRMLPMLHSNKGRHFENIHRSSMKMVTDTEGSASLMEPADDIRALSQMMDQKEIYVFPFSIAPESPSPSGHVNFSKVSHASLDIKVDGFSSSGTPNVDYQVDVYGQYFNWLAIKQGRAMLSFA
ncbi:MAG: hypothetical protein CMJ58_02795 [Planctomycetaceae bacterium]|nr:hypothetical protein [Planctomycetaceae bacterium]